MKVVRSFELKKIEEIAINEIGIPSLVLMERASYTVYRYIMDNFHESKKIIIICGCGNNGADGLAIARMLHIQKRKVSIFIAGDVAKATDEFVTQLNILKNIEANIVEEFNPAEYNIVVDAIFGIGLKRSIEGKYKEYIEKINNTENFVIAVDIPSGVDGDTGNVLGTAVKADMTITFSALKAGMILPPGNEYTGNVKICDIGIPDSAFDNNYKIITYGNIRELNLKARDKNGNKGTFGKVLVIAGSKNMSGAAYFSGKAAYRMGSGLVRVLTCEENREILQKMIPEAVLLTYDNVVNTEVLKESLQWCDSIVIGPGLSVSSNGSLIVEEVLKSKKKTVIDADGLNIISEKSDLTDLYHDRVIITPHIGEMSRLCGQSIPMIKENIIETAVDYSEKHRITVVLKDSKTIVANGLNKIYINSSGNDGMATAGSGDVLSGIAGSVYAVSEDSFKAACDSVYIHGLAGNSAAMRLGRASVMASDIADAVSEIIKEIN